MTALLALAGGLWRLIVVLRKPLLPWKQQREELRAAIVDDILALDLGNPEDVPAYHTKMLEAVRGAIQQAQAGKTQGDPAYEALESLRRPIMDRVDEIRQSWESKDQQKAKTAILACVKSTKLDAKAPTQTVKPQEFRLWLGVTIASLLVFWYSWYTYGSKVGDEKLRKATAGFVGSLTEYTSYTTLRWAYRNAYIYFLELSKKTKEEQAKAMIAVEEEKYKNAADGMTDSILAAKRDVEKAFANLEGVLGGTELKIKYEAWKAETGKAEKIPTGSQPKIIPDPGLPSLSNDPDKKSGQATVKP